MVWPLSTIRYTLHGKDVVRLAEKHSPKMLVPIHYDGLDALQRAGRGALAQLEASSLKERVRWLEPGRRETLRLRD